MSTITSTPATKLSIPTWAFLAVSKNLQIVDGAIVPTLVANLSAGQAEFLGDAAGHPVQALPGGPGMTNVALDLSEVVTRADGTSLTVLQLLDAIALAAVPV